MYTVPQLQTLQSTQRALIREIQSDISSFRKAKREADEKGNLEDEFIFHNALKNSRAALSKWVKMQKACKAMLKGK